MNATQYTYTGTQDEIGAAYATGYSSTYRWAETATITERVLLVVDTEKILEKAVVGSEIWHNAVGTLAALAVRTPHAHLSIKV